MSKVDKQQLRELAEKATPGPWWIDSHGHRMSAAGGSETVFIASEKMGEAKRHPETGNLSHWPNDWDASFIAAANPATILDLLDEIETLEGLYRMRRETEERQMIELRAEVAKLREIAMRLIDLQNSGRGAGQAFELWNDVADQARQALGLEVRRG